MPSEERVPRAFLKNYSPSAVAREGVPATAPDSSGFTIRSARAPFPVPYILSQHPLPGAAPHAFSGMVSFREGILPGG